MKKILTLVLGLQLFLVPAQITKYDLFSESSAPANQEEADPGTGNLGGDDGAAIDDYIPLLIIAAAAGMAWYATRRKAVIK